MKRGSAGKAGDRQIRIAAQLKRAGQMSPKRFKHFKAGAAARVKRKKDEWI